MVLLTCSCFETEMGSAIFSRSSMKRKAYPIAMILIFYYIANMDPRPTVFVADEAQFLTQSECLSDLARIVDELDGPVMQYFWSQK